MRGKNNKVDRRLSKKDRLIEYLSSNKPDPEMEALWAKYEFIEDKLRSMKKQSAMHVVCKKYGISKSMAYELIKEVEVFSGMAHKPNREYLMWVQIEGLQRDIELASAKNDFRAVAALRKELRLWLYDTSDTDLDLLSKIEARQYNITLNINGESLSVPLEKFYKMAPTDIREINSSNADVIAEWEEVEQMLNDTE